ncbi:ABC transporter ATP-binding protein [Hafnia alvei]|uniref:ABC transporter ATP-binding protein n=1 Tax=Hafnia alvei TaxID=569 RepID=UPI002AAF80F0|nr:ABC transporter ATP-binding protein [Hafnia alvei]
MRTQFAFKKARESSSFTALSNVSFTLEKGESIGIIGHNGAGKSTLLKLLTRISRPTSGSITVDGKMSCLLEVGAGFHHDLSGYENIFLAGAILGMSRRDINSRLASIIEFTELGDFINSPVRQYSSGMFLRLAFSVGIHLGSDILVIDEALAVGDQIFRSRCLQKIKHFQQQGGTLVLVSHDENQVRAVCDRALLLTQGCLVFDGNVEPALLHYNLLPRG